MAFDTFTRAVNYIRLESSQNADNVKRELLEKIEGLARRPELYGLGKYKQPNDGNYRAFELHSYRIAYLVKEEEIVIVRIRHVRQNPKVY
ncbi:MAG: type II toxin-antitoxin system RelE/ParE family toxin [Pedobacter sp.]|nr:MAG: type II toxin-antitoxin system RelE/ParE family toxin [Pedobacter sp.]